MADAAEKLVRVTGTVEPDPAVVAKYEAGYRKFLRLYPALRTLED